MKGMTKTTPQFWWPEDARTHTDKNRCGNCGHDRSFHSHSDKGRNTGPCTCTDFDMRNCSCREGSSPKDRD